MSKQVQQQKQLRKVITSHRSASNGAFISGAAGGAALGSFGGAVGSVIGAAAGVAIMGIVKATENYKRRD